MRSRQNRRNETTIRILKINKQNSKISKIAALVSQYSRFRVIYFKNVDTNYRIICSNAIVANKQAPGFFFCATHCTYLPIVRFCYRFSIVNLIVHVLFCSVDFQSIVVVFRSAGVWVCCFCAVSRQIQNNDEKFAWWKCNQC